jgi:RNA polymerase sigma factor (sigma-70 family)
MTVIEYNQCVDSYADGVYRFILKSLKDDEWARDIVQESFVRLWEKVKDVNVDKAKSYLFTTAYHTMIDFIRKNSRFEEYNPELLNNEHTTNSYNDLKEVINEAVSKLPEIQRSVVLLRDYEGYSYEEIGGITGLTESQVKVYIFRARTFLKEYIGKLDLVI